MAVFSKIGIIGGGISGLAAAKQRSEYQPVVFEATDSLGGVWKGCSFASTRLQTPRCDYEFSDYPWPERDNSSFKESYLVGKLPLLKYGLKPEHPFEEDHASCQVATLPENFFTEADKGKITFKRASTWWFWEERVELEDHAKLEAHVVLLATGYDGNKELKAIISVPFPSLIEFPSGMMPLSRGTINPPIPNMAFVGYIESASNLQTAELRCKWLARLVGNQFRLPGVEKKMLEQRTLTDGNHEKNHQFLQERLYFYF